jgi:hypothetical protein
MVEVISSSKEWGKAFKYWKTLRLDEYICEIDQKKSEAVFFYQTKECEGRMRVIIEKSSWKFDEK